MTAPSSGPAPGGRPGGAPGGAAALLDRCDAYLDAVPRAGARVEEVGPFTLFVSTGGWPYYARPARPGTGRGRGPGAGPAAGPVTAADVEQVLARQDELGVPRALEWVEELSPQVGPAARAAGLRVLRHPLLVLGTRAPLPPPPPGVRVRLLGADDAAVPASTVVADLAFAEPGTAAGPAGPAGRDAALAGRAADADDHVRGRLRRGLTVTAVAEEAGSSPGPDGAGPDGGRWGVVASGSHQPVDGATEVVGVATLPARRRRGLGAAVTAALVDDALRGGASLVLLSASDDAVARVYERLGFVRVGHAGAAEPPA